MLKKINYAFATTLFTGYFPIAPGTVGSLAALILFLAIPELRGMALLVTIVTCFFLGVRAATEVEKKEGHDASIITIDEVVGMWISVLFIPGQFKWTVWLGAFFLFRLFDIVKPFPINRSQKAPAGWGIMVDDVLAGICANLVFRAILLVFLR